MRVKLTEGEWTKKRKTEYVRVLVNSFVTYGEFLFKF